MVGFASSYWPLSFCLLVLVPAPALGITQLARSEDWLVVIVVVTAYSSASALIIAPIGCDH